MDHPVVNIIGGGLAGCEAAHQCVRRGVRVRLYDMKPHKMSPAHESAHLAELVCSNSFRSAEITSAVGLLKEEMRTCHSLIMEKADETAVPAGKALAVDRSHFAEVITAYIEHHPLIERIQEEVKTLPPPSTSYTILATGPLTSEPLATDLLNLTGTKGLSFYDAIAPIVDAESLNFEVIYQKSRYDDGPGDYLNCPMDEGTYQNFIDELARAQYVPLADFEEPKYFEGCLPVEVIRSRGDDTLRFGPMKPVGLPDPRTGLEPYAVVQLRKENEEGSAYNMVGFQTKLTYGEQKRIFRMIPGMEHASFLRLGSIHRNTFIQLPLLLFPTLQFKTRPDLLLAGQLSGVEGYVESAAMGLLAGINGARLALGISPTVPPPATAMGALIHHLTETEPKKFQPSNVNFGLFPPLGGKKIKKKFRGEERAKLGAEALAQWLETEKV
jgi:methylenetetrahydrofolate--tRNA-(uracil-5-)-methyltransferase